MKIQKTRSIIKEDSYKNKTQSYKSRSKTKNKIKKIKNDKIKVINTLINTYINTHTKEKDLTGQRNNTTLKDKITKIYNKISLSNNKKNIFNKK